MALTRPPVGKTDNLAELEDLNEASLLLELKVRYDRDTIYTYVGEILVTGACRGVNRVGRAAAAAAEAIWSG